MVTTVHFNDPTKAIYYSEPIFSGSGAEKKRKTLTRAYMDIQILCEIKKNYIIIQSEWKNP